MSYYPPKTQQSGGAFQTLQNNKVQPKGFFAAMNQSTADKPDLESIQGLVNLAREKGLIIQEQVGNRDQEYTISVFSY